MKKYFLLIFLLATVLIGCDKKQEEPQPAAYTGDWYCYHALSDFHMEINGALIQMDTTIRLDTTFTNNKMRFCLTPQGKVVIEQDTIGTYRYDELEGLLFVHTNVLVDNLPMDTTMLKTLIDINSLRDLTFRYTYTATNCKAEYELSDSGVLASIPYSYTTRIQLYLQREK